MNKTHRGKRSQNSSTKRNVVEVRVEITTKRMRLSNTQWISFDARRLNRRSLVYRDKEAIDHQYENLSQLVHLVVVFFSYSTFVFFYKRETNFLRFILLLSIDFDVYDNLNWHVLSQLSPIVEHFDFEDHSMLEFYLEIKMPLTSVKNGASFE